MKTLLVQPRIDETLPTLWPPMGLAYLATALRQGGHEVEILDYLRDCRDDAQFAARVRRAAPALIGFNVYTVSLRETRRLLQCARAAAPGATLVVGGPHVSALPERVFEFLPEAHYAIRGEGEVPLRKLADSIAARSLDPRTIPALVFREQGQLILNEPYFAADVSEYGIPAYDILNPPSYFSPNGMMPGQFPVFFSRGCPFPCTFCAAKVTSGQNLRRRSLDAIMEELRLLKERYGITRFVIYDEGFGAAKSFIMAFCERILREGFEASFELGTGIRLDQVDDELLETIKRAHFVPLIALGIESGSERILNLMKKRTNLALIREKVRLMRRHGLRPGGYFILGYPTETREEMKQTIRLALELPLQEASFTAFMPLPGTEATRWLIEHGELPTDFDFSQVRNGAITYAPEGMSLRELQRIRRLATLRFYGRPHILFPMLSSWRQVRYVVSRFFRIFFHDRTAGNRAAPAVSPGASPPPAGV